MRTRQGRRRPCPIVRRGRITPWPFLASGPIGPGNAPLARSLSVLCSPPARGALPSPLVGEGEGGGRHSRPAISLPQRTVNRLPHRISTRKINILSPGIFGRFPDFPCATHLIGRTLSLPHRIARHRTGATASGRGRVNGRCKPVGTPKANGQTRLWWVPDPSHQRGKGRCGCEGPSGPSWQQGLARVSGWGASGNGPTCQEGVRGVARPCKDRVRAPGAFSDSPQPKETGPVHRWGSRSCQGYFSASVAPVPDP